MLYDTTVSTRDPAETPPEGVSFPPSLLPPSDAGFSDDSLLSSGKSSSSQQVASGRELSISVVSRANDESYRVQGRPPVLYRCELGPGPGGCSWGPARDSKEQRRRTADRIGEAPKPRIPYARVGMDYPEAGDLTCAPRFAAHVHCGTSSTLETDVAATVASASASTTPPWARSVSSLLRDTDLGWNISYSALGHHRPRRVTLNRSWAAPSRNWLIGGRHVSWHFAAFSDQVHAQPRGLQGRR